MKRTVLIARALLSLLGIVLIVLGVFFWAGRELALIPLHVALGMLFVLCLWVLVWAAFHMRAARGLALIVLIWSLIVPALGVAQVQLLRGGWHWVVQALHLIVGLIAMGLGHALARRIQSGARKSTPAAGRGG